MKKNWLNIMWRILVPAVICVMAQSSLALATDYTFFIKNNLNSFTYSENKQAVCSNISISLMAGTTTLATQSVKQLNADQTTTLTLTAPVCSQVAIQATCKFKDYTRKEITKTKQIRVGCKGGEIYLSPSPMSREWTTLAINYYESR